MKIRLGYVVNIMIIVLMAIIAFTPIISRNQPVFWMPALFLLWCVSAFSVRTVEFNIKPTGPLFWMAVLLGWQIFLSIIGINDTNLFGYLAVIPKYGIVLIMCFVLKNYRYKEKMLLLVLLCIAFLANVLDNDIIAFGMPEMFLNLNRSIYASSTNLGSTPMTVCCLFFFPVMLSLLLEKEHNRFKYLAVLLFAIVGYYFYYLNSRGIAFFLSLLFLWEYLVATRFYKEPHRIGYYLMISIVAVLIYYLALAPLLGYLLNLFSNNANLVERFSEIQDYSTYGESEGSLSGRLTLYSISIRTWLGSVSNFIFGVGVHEYEVGLFGYAASGVGHHSEFFDCLAYYGVFGGIFLYKWLSVSFKFVLKRMQIAELYNKYLTVVVVFVLHCFVNNTLDTFDCVFMCFLIIPLFFDILNEKRYEYAA